VAKTPISNEELQLRKRARRRLVGAILLVLLVVVLVPMFLEHEPRLQKQDMDIRIPPVPGQTQAPSFPGPAPAPAAPSAVPAEKAKTPEQPAIPPSAEPAAQSAGPAVAAEASTATAPASKPPAVPAAPRPAPAVQPQSESAANPSPAAPSKEAAAQPAAAEGFVIQLGAFSNASNARQLLQQIRAHKFPAYTEPVKTARGEKTRVRVGPYPSVEVAERARDRLKALKLAAVSEARVVRAGE
jgi:DedD protein